MSTLSKILELDLKYSYRLAMLFDLDSPIRRFFQIATHTGTFIAWIIGLGIALFVSDNKTPILSLIVIYGFMLLPVFIIKQTVRRKRPEYRDERFASIAFDKFSFPSGHATRASYAMIIMPFYTPELTFFWIIWGLTMIFSRLILGVHYISDIIVGILIGSISMLILIWMGWIPVIPLVAQFF
ncbi:MAG: phosphatase PAP2 family protein [Candidatus Heimdallarchaeota archaeon]|nr:phosphatase PAP2 family protein [Candidatus Heimdallarchaeota archaeon]